MLETRHKQIQIPIVVQIRKVGPHRPLRHAVLIVAHHGDQGDVAKGPVAVVPIEKVSHTVIGDKQIRVPVVVVIAEGNPHALSQGVKQAAHPGDVGEGPIALIPIEHIRNSPVDIRAAIIPSPLPSNYRAADLILNQRIVQIILHIQIQVPVVVVVHKDTRLPPALIPHTGLLRYVGEGPIPVVAIQHIATEVGHIEVEIPVVVVIRGTASLAIGSIPHTGLLRYVGESPIPVVAIQHITHRLLEGHIPQRPAVDYVNIYIAIAVVVKETGPSTHCLGVVEFPRPTVDVPKRDPCSGGDIRKTHPGGRLLSHRLDVQKDQEQNRGTGQQSL